MGSKMYVDVQNSSSITAPLTMENMYLMDSWRYPLGILALYLSTVTLGPKIMKNNKPFELKRTIMCYNLFQVVANFGLFIKITSHLRNCSIFCTTLDMFPLEEAQEQLLLHYGYILLKILDLIDTVFFILRKKSRQISFLHVYHHAGMILVSWICAKYHPGGHAMFLGFANTLVHFIMYIYYTLTVLFPGRIWWKKYLTQLQILQHLFIFTSYFLPLTVPTCKAYSTLLLLIFLPNNLSIIYLFGRFYAREYITNEKQGTKKED